VVPRLLVAASVAFIAGAVSGALGEDDDRPSSMARPPVGLARLERPELVAFRVTSGMSVRYELVRSRAGGELVRVVVGGTQRDRMRPALFERAAWSPDGRRLAFTAEIGRLAGFANDIYLVRADGSALRRLTFDSRSFHPVWAPDGRWILFARRPRGRPEALTDSDARRLASASIWSMRPDGSDQRQLTRLVTGRSDIPESFSPDGATLALTRTTFVEPDEHGRAANRAEVWVMRPDGSGTRRLADRSTDPAFSPNGRRIAFASDRDVNGQLSYGDRAFFAHELYVMDADGSHQRRLTRTRGLNELQPAWLPSGKRVAYQRGKTVANAEATLVMQANADGTCARPLLADPRLKSWYAAPAWRPGAARAGDGPLRC
jgi:Tol biopolymer transport system component